jgi:hypothetical protein
MHNADFLQEAKTDHKSFRDNGLRRFFVMHIMQVYAFYAGALRSRRAIES